MRQVIAATRPAKRALFVKVLALFTAAALAAGLTTLPAISHFGAAPPPAAAYGTAKTRRGGGAAGRGGGGGNATAY